MAKITSSDPRVKKYGLLIRSKTASLQVAVSSTKLVYEFDQKQEHLPDFNEMNNCPYVEISITRDECDFLLANHSEELNEVITDIADYCDEQILEGELRPRVKRSIRNIHGKEFRPTSGHVYVFRAGPTNLFKVGATTKSPTDRIKELQTGCPFLLEFFYGFESDDCWTCESKIHYALNEYRTIGEWFDVDPEIINSTIDSMF